MAGAKKAEVPAVVRLGIRAVSKRVGAHKATIWRWYTSGRFPVPEYLGQNRLWRLDVIEAWEQEQLARPAEARRGASNLSAAEG